MAVVDYPFQLYLPKWDETLGCLLSVMKLEMRQPSSRYCDDSRCGKTNCWVGARRVPIPTEPVRVQVRPVTPYHRFGEGPGGIEPHFTTRFARRIRLPPTNTIEMAESLEPQYASMVWTLNRNANPTDQARQVTYTVVKNRPHP